MGIRRGRHNKKIVNNKIIKMDWMKKTSDWQVCCLGQVAAGTGLAGGVFLFCFYSATAGGSAYYTFNGLGAGVGGNASGVINPGDYQELSAPWTRLCNISYTCGVKPFNTHDLHGAGGRITSLGAGAWVVGYGVTYITAGPFSDPSDHYFYSQNVGGFGWGLGAGKGFALSGSVLLGAWVFVKEASLKPW
jgi:hypothetical protein